MKKYKGFRIRLYGAWLFATLIFTGFLFTQCKSGSKRSKEITTEVTDTITGIAAPGAIYFDSLQLDSFLAAHPSLNRFSKAYHDFYGNRKFQYVWYNEAGIVETAYGLTAHLLNKLEKDSAELPYNSRLDSLMHARGFSMSASPDIETEFLLTGMYFFYTEKLLLGVDESISQKLGWLIPRRKISMSALLDSFISAKSWEDFERNALNEQYFKLKDALGKYRKIQESGMEVQIPTLNGKPSSIKPGDSSSIIGFLRKRLTQLGYAPVLPDTDIYMPDMLTAVKTAKKSYGFKADSLIDNSLINDLNVPAVKREQQLLVNMERLRWIPAEVRSGELIFVNIPDYKLFYFKDGKPDWSCRVVVGAPVHKTVIFSGMMDYVVFSPYWYVPQSIIQNEIGVSRAKSPSYLKRKNMEWSGNSLREKPGPNNSLGRVKFIFPNSNNIYLHDTPAKDLFSRDTRAFSHGCIRVGEPFELAKRVLAANPEWNDKRIDSAMQGLKELRVNLKRKIPVYIGYFTAFADKDGLIHFRRDLYKRDAPLFESLVSK